MNPNFYTRKEDAQMTLMQRLVTKPTLDSANKRYDSAFNQLQKAAHMADIVEMIENDVEIRGAKAGSLGAFSQQLAGLETFATFLTGKKRDEASSYGKNVVKANEEDLALIIKNPNAYFKRYNINANSRQAQNIRTLVSSFDRGTAAADAALDTSIVNLAYAVAKAREEGGRFSVSDIELALRSIGNSSNTEVLLSRLKRTAVTILEPAINNYEDAIGMLLPEQDPAGKLQRYKNGRFYKLKDKIEYYKTGKIKEEKAKKNENDPDVDPNKDDDSIPDPYL